MCSCVLRARLCEAQLAHTPPKRSAGEGEPHPSVATGVHRRAEAVVPVGRDPARLSGSPHGKCTVNRLRTACTFPGGRVVYGGVWRPPVATEPKVGHALRRHRRGRNARERGAERGAKAHTAGLRLVRRRNAVAESAIAAHPSGRADHHAASRRKPLAVGPPRQNAELEQKQAPRARSPYPC